MVCVFCVCVREMLSLSGDTVCSLPQCIKAHSVALGEGISISSFCRSLSLHPARFLPAPQSFPLPLLPCFSSWQGRRSTLAISPSIFTVHFALAPRWSTPASRESRAALAKCCCPLRTWMICCTTNTPFLPHTHTRSLSLAHTHIHTEKVGGKR